MGKDAAYKDSDELTPAEVALLFDESPDLRGVHRLEYLEAVRQDTLSRGAKEHERELLSPDEPND